MRSKLASFLRSPNKPVLVRAVSRSLRRPASSPFPLTGHREGTYQWLCAAQDASPDPGVAGWYHLVDGWSASYPETTGYIIPTFLAYARARGVSEARERALAMARWETDVQLPSGAVRSGLLQAEQGPAVFNTGQVLFGWTAAWRETGESAFVESIEKAGRWLVDAADPDGAWRQALSDLTTSAVQTYNVRASWGLAQAGKTLGREAWVEAAVRNCEWALGQQNEHGWYADNAFSPGEQPLLHTISYAIEGLLGVGLLMSEDRFIDSARRAIDGLLAARRRTGRFHGRYDSHWNPTVGWRCLPGEAQVATVLLRYCRAVSESDDYRSIAEVTVRDLCALQQTSSRSGPIRGGLSGSYPVWGHYSRNSYLNWAAKFHLDALLLLLDDLDPDADI